MIDPIRGHKNIARIQSVPHSVRSIVVKELMNSMALKPAILNWQIFGNYHPISLLKETLSLDHPLIAESKKAIFQMDDNRIMKEEKTILDIFYNKLKSFIKPGVRLTLAELVENGKSPVCVEQFYSSTLTNLGVLINNQTDLINGMSQIIVEDYRKTMIFTIALDIISKSHDFSSAVKKRLLDFPHLEKVIKPNNYLAELDAKDLVWSGRLLNHIHEVMNIDVTSVIIDDKTSFDAYAKVKNGQVTINLQELSKIALFDSPDTKKKIIIEK